MNKLICEKPIKIIKGAKNIKKIELFKKLGNYNEQTHCTDIVDVDNFTGEYKDLMFGNGGDWCRRSNAPPYKIVTMKGNGKYYYTFDNNIEETKKIEDNFNNYCKKNNFDMSYGPKIKLIQICGLLDYNNEKRPIRKDIKDYYKQIPCVVCGSKSELVCDHKNDLYNDPKVLNTKTQIIDDFQSLCTHCNLLKRQIMKNTLKTNKRYGATNIPSLKCFGIDFTLGNETLDVKNPNAMCGTYWYDPCDFMNKIKIKNN
jgi:hypothetical protein